MIRMGNKRMTNMWNCNQCIVGTFHRHCALIVLSICVFVANCARPVHGQSLRPAMASTGEPFGVFLVDVPIPPGMNVEDVRVLVSDSEDRVFYPAVAVRTTEIVESEPMAPGRFRPGGLIDRVRNAIRTEKKRKVPVSITVAGLFRGSEPLNFQLQGDVNQRVQLSPQAVDGHAVLLREWWTILASQALRAEKSGDHPLVMHKVLMSLLARRLDLPWPMQVTDPEEAKAAKKKLVEPLGTLALLSGIDPLRDEILDETLARSSSESPASLPAPQDINWLPVGLPKPPDGIEVESLASCVPPECFYLRFGSFANYVWFQDLSARNGGDLAQIVLVRGFNYETSARMERTLNTRMTAVSKMFGDKIISDMAIIGRDLYMKEGASLGVVFEANNMSLLMSSFQNERKQALTKYKDATLKEVTIEGKQVSLLSTPDNRVRSFLVANGQQVLLTSSRHIAERFLQVAAGAPSLGSLDAFRWARVWMPAANKYSVFAYLSPDFFHGLVSPQYQIELHRRLEAIAHIEAVEVASRLAAAEGKSTEIDAMITEGFLPVGFDDRADGTKTLQSPQGWIDSRRGIRGSFLPIVDVPVEQVNERELARYERLANFYRTEWQQMDPMLVGLRRFQVDGQPDAERIGIEAYVAPFTEKKYGWVADLLASAAPVAIATPPDDVVSVQMLMNGTTPLTTPRQPYHLFFGVKDLLPPKPEDTKGLIQTFRALKATPGYIGAYPNPGYLDQLPLGLGGGRPDAFGFSRSLIGIYRWQGNGFSLISFDRSILEHSITALRPIQVQDSAQVRVKVNNLAGTKLSSWINQQWYNRASRASHGNAALLDFMHQQLKVPGAETLDVAQKVLDVRLNCPLGGTFEFVPQATDPKQGWWTSTAWTGEGTAPDGTKLPPAGYSAPWLDWFRGAQLHLTQFPGRLAVVGTFDIRKLPPVKDTASSDEPAALPELNFDLFQLPFKMFGGGDGKSQDAKTPEKKSF